MGWESSALTLAFSPEDADSLAQGAGLRAAVDVSAFQVENAFDLEGFTYVLHLWATALEIDRDERPASIGLAGVGDWLLAQGLSLAGPEGRDAAAAVWALAAGTTLTASEVAEQCGFVDVSSFTQHFRKRMGESPAVYRRARR